MRLRRLAFLLPLLFTAVEAPRAAAQQFVTDDATLTELGACQLEGWHGEVTSWILPACRFVGNLELSVGVGFVGHGDGRRTEYVVQGKYLLRELTSDGFGIGLVAGIGYDPLSQVAGGVEGVFAYVPVSLSLRDDRVVLHGNLGWHVELDEHTHDGVVHGAAHHALIWAARADLLLPVVGERFTLIGELFGEDGLRPEYQVGVRSELVAERLLMDVSWGGHTQGGLRGAGWTIGLAWTPPPLF
jgi:hypothetical protein